MKPGFLRLSGFLSYWDPVELDFAGFNLACVSGANGAGKSSLLDAMTWALFGMARRKDDALINSHADAAEVCFDFEYEENVYRVLRSRRREKSTQIDFFIRNSSGDWKPLTERTMSETEASIRQTLRMDYETFTNASFFLQGKADQFAQKNAGDRKRILASILGLEVWEVYRDRAVERRRERELDLAAIKSQLEEIERELEQESERRQRLKQLEENLQQVSSARKTREMLLDTMRRTAAAREEQRRLVEALEAQYRVTRQHYEGRAAQLDELIQKKESYRQQIANADQVEAAYAAWQKAHKEMERWDAIASDFRQYESMRTAPLLKIEAERSRLEQERQHLAGQQKLVDEAEAQVQLIGGQLLAAQAVLETMRQQMEQRLALEDDLRRIQMERADTANENKRLRDEMNTLKERINQLKEAQGANCPVCERALGKDERLNLVANLEVQGKELGNRFRTNQEFLHQAEQRCTDIEAELSSLRRLEETMRQQQRSVDQLNDRLQQSKTFIAMWLQGGAVRLAELESILAEGRFAIEARAELLEVDAALKALGYDAVAHDRARTAEQVGRSSENDLRLLENARAALDPLEKMIIELSRQLALEKGDLEKQNAAYLEAAEKYQREATNFPDLATAENELFTIQEQENRLRMQVGGAVQAVEVLNTLRNRRVELVSRQDGLAVDIDRVKRLEKAFGKDGVPALLIEQALPEIESRANEFLDRLTSGGMSVRFLTQREYKDKSRDDRKETLDILISDASGTREYEMFSGGEAFRVNFAIRLALSRVLAKRAGARLQTLVIDEGFGSQDADGRQRLVEAINLVRPDFEKILVITHLDDLKDAFPARIEVGKTHRGSSLRVML